MLKEKDNMPPDSREQRLRQARDEKAIEYAGNGKCGFPFSGRVAFIAGFDAGVAWADQNPKDNYSKEDVGNIKTALELFVTYFERIKSGNAGDNRPRLLGYEENLLNAANFALSKFTAKGEREK